MHPFLHRYRSALLVLGAVLLLALWIASGSLTRPDSPEEMPEARQPVAVGVTLSEAQTIERLVRARGELLPEQAVTVRAKTGGQVAETPVAEGDAIEEGAVLARLDPDDRPARVRQAEAAVRGAQSDHEAAQALGREGFQARLREEASLAELEAARARLESARLELEHTTIRAPISGVVKQRHIGRGDFVTAGEPIVEIVENNPLRAVIQLPQQPVHAVRAGQEARLSLLDGSQHAGVVSFVSPQADPRTRTFRSEVRMANPERRLPSGISVQVEIPVSSVEAHPLSPALISQDSTGRLGVMLAERDPQGQERARFVPVEPVRAEANRLWVTGLPPQARLITLGHGFVSDGEPVRVVQEANANETIEAP